MKTIATIRHSQLFPGEPDKDAAQFSHRRAARAIVFSPNDAVALLYVGKYGYHKLPGGGVEDGEDTAAALERELIEEIGCHAQVAGELGQIIEYRDAWDMQQTSECFVARQIGAIQPPQFTEKEQSEDFSIVWARDLQHAITLLQNDKPHDYGGKFIHARDLQFLRAVL